MKLKICLFTLVCLQTNLFGAANQAAEPLNVNSNLNSGDMPTSTKTEFDEARKLNAYAPKTVYEFLKKMAHQLLNSKQK